MTSLVIRAVDLVQTAANSDEDGTLYVSATADGADMVRICRNFPVSLYEKWLADDFSLDMYLSEIAAYPCTEEPDEEQDE